MTQKQKIEKVRELLGIPEELRICQHLANQLEAHDYEDMFYLPDDVLIPLLEKQVVKQKQK